MSLDWRAAARSTSDGLDLFFFRRQRLIDQLHIAVGELLHLVGLLAVFVLGDLAVLLGLLQRFHAVSAHVAYGDAAKLGIFVGELGELGTALGRKLGNRDTDRLTIWRRVEAEACLADRLRRRDNQALVPDADGQQARLGRTDRADLVEWH